jgi:hypothetical protein
VLLSSHAACQVSELAPHAEMIVEHLRRVTREDLSWTAQRLPPQQGREVWLLGAGPLRVLFDIEDGDLTVHGFGRRPGWSGRRF